MALSGIEILLGINPPGAVGVLTVIFLSGGVAGVVTSGFVT